jgi:hypothetical protein
VLIGTGEAQNAISFATFVSCKSQSICYSGGGKPDSTANARLVFYDRCNFVDNIGEAIWVNRGRATVTNCHFINTKDKDGNALSGGQLINGWSDEGARISVGDSFFDVSGPTVGGAFDNVGANKEKGAYPTLLLFHLNTLPCPARPTDQFTSSIELTVSHQFRVSLVPQPLRVLPFSLARGFRRRGLGQLPSPFILPPRSVLSQPPTILPLAVHFLDQSLNLNLRCSPIAPFLGQLHCSAQSTQALNLVPGLRLSSLSFLVGLAIIAVVVILLWIHRRAPVHSSAHQAEMASSIPSFPTTADIFLSEVNALPNTQIDGLDIFVTMEDEAYQ